jgi:hypothetical protein
MPSVPIPKHIDMRLRQVCPRYSDAAPIGDSTSSLFTARTPTSLRPTSYHPYCDYDLPFEHPAAPKRPNTLHPHDIHISLA